MKLRLSRYVRTWQCRYRRRCRRRCMILALARVRVTITNVASLRHFLVIVQTIRAREFARRCRDDRCATTISIRLDISIDFIDFIGTDQVPDRAARHRGWCLLRGKRRKFRAHLVRLFSPRD